MYKIANKYIEIHDIRGYNNSNLKWLSGIDWEGSMENREINVAKKPQSKIKKITLRNIAEKADVSLSCVARYVNKSGYVSKEKSAKIARVMEELHYIPNQQAKALRGEDSRLLGNVYLDTDENTFFSKVSRRIERIGLERGYCTLSFVIRPENVEILDNVTTSMMAYGVDGIIINTGSEKRFMQAANKMIRTLGIPAVMIERSEDIYEVEKVLIDNSGGSYAAVSELIKKGHKKIAFIGVTPREAVEAERYRGYVSAMQLIDKDYASSHSYFVEDYSVEEGYLSCTKIFRNQSQENYPTAIFASSDILAAGVYNALREIGLRIPEDISVVGYDDTIAQFLAPSLSTLKLPVEEIASAALNMLIEKITNGQTYTGHKTVLISPVFVNRSSIRTFSDD